jgi:ribose transport system substrate-binding protein
MRNVIPISCALVIAATVVGVKLTRHDVGSRSIVWYGNAAHPYITQVRLGVEAFAKDTSVPIFITVGQEWTQDNQNINVEALSTQGYRGFSLYPADPAGANGLFRTLREHGQNVVAYGAEPALPTPASFTVATDIKGAAMTATEDLIRLMGGRGNLLNVLESATDVNSRKRDEAVREVVARHPGVRIIQTLSDMEQMGEATIKLQSVLAARGDEINGIIATGYNTTVVATAILTEWNKNPAHHRIHFVGIDNDTTVIRAIKDGEIDATVAQNPFGHGYISCAILNLMNEGWTPKQPYQFIDAGFVLIHPDNVDSYQHEVRLITKRIMGELKTRYLNPPK